MPFYGARPQSRTYEEVALCPREFAARVAFTDEWLRRAEFTTFEDHARRRLVAELRASIYGEHVASEPLPVPVAGHVVASGTASVKVVDRVPAVCVAVVGVSVGLGLLPYLPLWSAVALGLAAALLVASVTRVRTFESPFRREVPYEDTVTVTRATFAMYPDADLPDRDQVRYGQPIRLIEWERG